MTSWFVYIWGFSFSLDLTYDIDTVLCFVFLFIYSDQMLKLNLLQLKKENTHFQINQS